MGNMMRETHMAHVKLSNEDDCYYLKQGQWNVVLDYDALNVIIL